MFQNRKLIRKLITGIIYPHESKQVFQITQYHIEEKL